MVDSNGTALPVSSYTLNGLHKIVDNSTGTQIAGFPFNTTGPYGTTIGNSGIPFHCYQAWLDAEAHRTNGGVGYGTGTTNADCLPENPLPDPPGGGGVPVEICPSPIVISLESDGNSFPMSGPNDPVTFDILAAGHPVQITWTARRSNVGFLVLDHNGNGTIDSGAELFGNHSPMANGDAPPPDSNGYLALASYDKPLQGGNGDGHIGPEDAVWSRLLIWIDRNHDGISQRDEFMTLSEAKIVEIGYRFGLWNRQDQFGNLFRYRSYAIEERRHGRRETVPTYDVFFQFVN